ncbi:MAG: hypothetical protein P4L79_00730 [Legionella sp.]|uniref:hypothetical protein n=1 Tax=Legionella sp. TaxID=459 RepID=UPI0028417117|nr:hypothetical protein [Legionella sp.]
MKRKFEVNTSILPYKKPKYHVGELKKQCDTGVTLVKQHKYYDAFNTFENVYAMCIAIEQNINGPDSQDINEYFSEKYVRENDPEYFLVKSIAAFSAFQLSLLLGNAEGEDVSSDTFQKSWHWANEAEARYKRVLQQASASETPIKHRLVQVLFHKGYLIEGRNVQGSAEALYGEARAICIKINDEQNAALASFKLGKCLQLLSQEDVVQSIELLTNAYKYYIEKVGSADVSVEVVFVAYYLAISHLRLVSPQYNEAAAYFYKAFESAPFLGECGPSSESLALAAALSLKSPIPDFNNSWNLLKRHQENFNDAYIPINNLWAGCLFMELSIEAFAKCPNSPEAIEYLNNVLLLVNEYLDLEGMGAEELRPMFTQNLARLIGNGYALLKDFAKAEEYYGYSEQFMNQCQPEDALLAHVELLQSKIMHLPHLKLNPPSLMDIHELKTIQARQKETKLDRFPELNLNVGKNYSYRVERACEIHDSLLRHCHANFFRLMQVKERAGLVDLDIIAVNSYK